MTFRFLLTLVLLAALSLPTRAQDTASLPNILWITSEDNGIELGCYGDEYATTPSIDALASKGMKYTNCWSNAPVCAPARTTIISGLFPTCMGAQHMRSQVELPQQAKLYPQYMKEAGYYCTNNSKEDYNLNAPKGLWDESSRKAHWRKRKPGQPFFAVFNFTISHESKLRTRPHEFVHDPEEAFVPPYHPDTPEVRKNWAQYYDRLTQMDREVGRILEQLESDGLADNTIIFYYGDHGSGMPRGKRWLYQSGLRVPLIVHIPETLKSTFADQYEAGTTSNRLVSFVDLMPTILSISGTEIPDYLQGKAFLGPAATQDPKYIYGFRDRMDERYDMSRAIQNGRYMYIRNFYPHRPQGTYLDYMFQTQTTQVWKKMFDEGKLNAAQSAFWLPKPAEELYDLEADPYQVNNLAGTAGVADVQQEFRQAIKTWMLDIKDLGFIPEGEMLERAGNRSPYDFARQDNIDVAGYFDAASLASDPQPNDLDELLKLQTARDSVVRFWCAQGLLIRSSKEMNQAECLKAARGMASDSSPYVRCIANEVLARFGKRSDRKLAIEALLLLADQSESNSMVALTALNSLDWCEPTQAEVAGRVKSLPAKKLNLPGRYNSYVPRMVQRINEIATED